MTLKVLIHSHPEFLEKETCLQQHLKSFGVETGVITALSPETILQELKTLGSPILLVHPTLRFLVDPEHIGKQACDIGFFLKDEKKVDTDFFCFHPTNKTLALLEQWIQKGYSLIEGIETTLQTHAQSARFLRFSHALKVCGIQETTPLHRWLLKV